MEVIKEKSSEIQFLYLKGRLDIENAQLLEDNLMKLIDNGARQLIIDCSQIEFINNAGLRVLNNVARRILDVDGRIALHSPSQIAKDIFDQTGFSMVSRIYDTREEAVAGVAGSGTLSSSREDRRLASK
jgi:anti-anti-sigma factor